MKKFSDFDLRKQDALIGDKVAITDVLDKEVVVMGYHVRPSKFKDKNKDCLILQLKVDDEYRVLFTGSSVLLNLIEQVEKDNFPFITTIKKEHKHYVFT